MAHVFEAPGNGEWALDRSHYAQGATPISQWLLSEGFSDGLSRVFKELGMPAESIDLKFVHGYMYSRLRPLIGGDRPSKKAPPALAIKLVSRLHPAFRERNKTAMRTLVERPSNQVVEQWESELRPRLVAANQRFQNFDPIAANDADLQQHINLLLDQLRSNFGLHFWLHGHDLGPIARFLHGCVQGGLDPVDVVTALAGASPATTLPAKALCEIRVLVDAAPGSIDSLDDVRAISPEARQLLDNYLDERGHVLVTGYDIDNSTLIELPHVILQSIRSAQLPPTPDSAAATAALRAALPADQRAEFDQNLADARNVMDMRDDNGPLTIEWPVGLLRRALLAAGDRLVERSALEDRTHIFEITPEEARSLFAGSGPSAQALAERSALRSELGQLDPPTSLGPAEPEPPLEALPPALASLIAMTQTALKYMGMDPTSLTTGLTGAGIGSASYVGTARVANSADEAFDNLEPGDVLIVRATSPAFNAVLAIAGAVVTADGGVLSHAAVLARELDIPAVIGAPDALTIPDGSQVKVDAQAGTVTVVG